MPKYQVLFTGDFLFAGGAGRFFEGNGRDMVNSLAKIAHLPDSTLMFPGHEYTESNLSFASRLTGGEFKPVEERLAWAQARRGLNRPTIPSMLSDERATNVFMLCANENFANLVARLAGMCRVVFASSKVL